MKRYLLAAIIILSNLSGDLFAENSQITKLFEEQTPIKLTLVTDVIAIQNDKSEDPEYIKGMLIYHVSTYEFETFDMKVKARGKTRRLTELCDFPPLKFNFKKNNTKNTIFEGQDKLKFVSQCRQDEIFKDFLYEEYLLYKTYNVLTENSYRTRLVEIVIKDKQLRVDPIVMSGFLIEDDELFEKRTESKKFNEVVYSQDSCEAQSLDVLSMFQYMIGNTDWYINTKHNIDIFQKKDGTLIPVPYDFDFAGVINMPYAMPSKEIPIRRVTQRYFKGSCRELEAYESAISLFNSKQQEIYNLYNSFTYVEKPVIRKSIRYYNKFYKILNDPSLVESSFYQACNSQYVVPVTLNK
jgi:hypothetical protein